MYKSETRPSMTDESRPMDLGQIRDHLADRGIVIYGVIALPAVSLSVSRALVQEWHWVFTIHLIMAVVTVAIALIHKRLPYSIRAGWLVSLCYLVGIVGMLSSGSNGSNMAALALFPFLTSVAFGGRAAIIACLVSVCTMVIVGLAACSGVLTYSPEIINSLNSPIMWALNIVILMCFVPPALIAIGVINSQLQKSLDVLRKNWDYRTRLFESSRVPTFVLDPDNHHHVDCNPAAVEVFGFSSREHLLDKTPIQLSPEFQADGSKSEESARAYIAKALTDDEVLFNWQHLREDGSVWDAEIHLMRFESDGKPLLQCSVTDVSRRRIAEEESRRSQARYLSLFDNASDAIFLLKDGVFVECNAKSLEMFKVTNDEIIGNTPENLSPICQPDGQLSSDKAAKMNELALSGEPQVFTWKHKRSDGVLFDAEVSLNALRLDEGDHVQAIVRDITDRKQAEEDFRRLALVVEQADEIVIVTDVSGIISYVNPAFEIVTGYTSEEALGRNASMLNGGQTSRQTYEDLWETILSGKTWRGRFVNRKKNGELYTENASISPLRTPEGEIISFVAVKRDVSRELTLEDRIRQTQKLEAIGSLAGGIAHDFNNILSGVLGYAEMAMSEAEKGSNLEKYIENVTKAGFRAKELVAQILTFSRQSGRDRKPTRLHVIAKEALKLLRGSIPSTVEFRQNILNCPAVMADSTEMHQILMNLCTNAYQALPETGGVINVSLTEVTLNEDDLISTPDLNPGKYVRLSVADNGKGMDEKTRERIFEPYFTTKERGDGTGLGLSTVHGIVQEMGGVIRVYSEKGQGSTFNILLPALESQSETGGAGQKSIESYSGNERVLLVDDDVAIAGFAEFSLSRIGYRITAHTSSLEALRVFKQDPMAFDIVITDQMMPKMRGTELSRELVALRPDIPIIICSGFGDVLTESGQMEPFIRDYVMKPVVAADLARAIRRVIDSEQTDS